MIIKKHKNKNEYLLTNKLWVRDFTKKYVPYVDINTLSDLEDQKCFLENEIKNSKKKYPNIDNESFGHDKAVIISDGMEFQKKTEFIKKLQDLNVATIGVNSALKKWNNKKSLNYYVINNPYKEALNFLPKSIFPKCIASIRTNYEFLDNYRGLKYKYFPTPEVSYAGLSKDANYQIDDYRNPICAAINLCYRFGVRKLLLLCCDNSFSDSRPGAIKLDENVFMYPQQATSHALIDANLYWLSNKIEAKNHSKNLEYNNASYIDEEGALDFLST